MSTNELVVPDMAESTTNTGSPDLVTNLVTSFMRAGDPTDVPPNFITFIVFILFVFTFFAF